MMMLGGVINNKYKRYQNEIRGYVTKRFIKSEAEKNTLASSSKKVIRAMNMVSNILQKAGNVDPKQQAGDQFGRV